MNLTGSNKKLLLVHKEMEKVSLKYSTNIMLTPQFYTMRKEKLPIKYLYQAKKIAFSFFEGLLDDPNGYEFFVFKEKEEWIFIAYNLEEIKTFLKLKGIALEYISKIFFVQQIPQSFVKPVMVNDKAVLMTIDGVVVLVPRSVLPDSCSLIPFNQYTVPRSGVNLSGSGNAFINKKEAIILSSVFLVFASIFFLEGWQYSQSIKIQKKELQELLDGYPSLQSKMQRENISFKYKMIDSRERKKRELVKTLASMLFKGVTLTAYDMNEKHFKVTFTCDNIDIAQKVEAFATKYNFKITSKKDHNVVVIEGDI